MRLIQNKGVQLRKLVEFLESLAYGDISDSGRLNIHFEHGRTH